MSKTSAMRTLLVYLTDDAYEYISNTDHKRIQCVPNGLYTNALEELVEAGVAILVAPVDHGLTWWIYEVDCSQSRIEVMKQYAEYLGL